MQSRNSRLFSTLLLPYLILVAIHLLFGFFRDIPVVLADELGYLGNARYMAGVLPMPDLKGCTFYHAGYSVFLMPASWISSDPIITYKIVMAINALFISTLYFPIYYVLCHIWSYSKKLSALIAFATCLYPAYFIHATLAWAENAFIPLYAILIANLGFLLRRKTYLAAITFGFLSAFIYTVHPRALQIIPTSILFLIVVGVWKVLPFKKIVAAIITSVIVFSETILLHDHLATLGWGGTTLIPFSVSEALRYLLSVQGILNYLLVISGQALYLLQASYGILLLGVVFIFQQLRKKAAADDNNSSQTQKILLGFLLLTSLVVALTIDVRTSFGLTQRTSVRADHYLYGRYNEGFAALYLGFGFLFLTEGCNDPKKRRSMMVSFTVLLFAFTLAVIAGRGQTFLVEPIAMQNIPGIFPAIKIFQTSGVLVISLASWALFVILLYLTPKKPMVGICVASCLFLSVGIHNYMFRLMPMQRDMNGAQQIRRSVQKSGPIESLSYDMAFYHPSRYFVYQYLLGNVRFNHFNSDRGEKPESKLVISGRGWTQAKEFGARRLGKEKRRDQVVWLLPKKVP